jgi:hypothetical protein
MDDQTFSLGVSYWPRRRSALAEQILCSWSEADPGALRDELAQIAELGFTTVRLELRWAEAMPSTRASAPALLGLEKALDRAHDVGLRAVVATLGGSLAGVLHLPDWAVGYRLPSDTARARRLGPPVLVIPDDQPEILAGERYRREPARDLYEEPEQLEAQRLLLREAVGNLAQHPAAAAWLLGADIDYVRRPSSARALAGWWDDLTGRARGHGARAVVGQVGPMGLVRKGALRPAQIAAHGARVALSAALPRPLAAERPADVAPIRLLHALAAALLKADGFDTPVIVTDLGIPTAAQGASGAVEAELLGRPASLTLASEEQQAALVEEALAALHRDGAGGVWLPAFADLHPAQWHLPPADRSWLARTAGLVAPDGREKPAAAAVRAFAGRLRAGALPAPAGPPALPVDPERYWHDPATSFRELLREWMEGQQHEG